MQIHLFGYALFGPIAMLGNPYLLPKGVRKSLIKPWDEGADSAWVDHAETPSVQICQTHLV